MNRFKRILHIGISDRLGGIESFLCNVYKNIDRQKVQFDFVSSGKDVPIENELKALGAEIYYVPYSNIFNYYKELHQLIKKNRYEIVHIHKNSAANILPFLACKKAGVKLVIAHSHNTAPSCGLFAKPLHYINRPVLRKLSGQKFACSVLAAQWLYGKKYIKKHSVQIINNGIDVDKFKLDLKVRNKIRESLGIDAGTYVLGNVGRLVPQKNQIFLLQILKELKKTVDDVRLVICGEGFLRGELEEYCKTQALTENVIFTGTVTNVNEMLQAFDVCLVPSLYEGLCISAVEAQCAGLPMVVSDTLSNETRLIQEYIVLPIDKGVKPWVEACLIYKAYEKKDESAMIVKKGYSIRQTARVLEQYYCSIG